MVGRALLRRLAADGEDDVLTRDRADLDLRDASAVDAFFARERPARVFLAAARVGGIWANQAHPADLIVDNLAIQTAVIAAAQRHGVGRLIFFGSGCAYPRDCAQPIAERALGTGPLEPSSQAYATAKIAGLTLCQAMNQQHGTEFVSAIPSTLYGPDDNFDPQTSHVLSALIRRIDDARPDAPVAIWGSGEPRREFLHVDDLAEACVRLMDAPGAALRAALEWPELVVNVGSGCEISIAALARLVQRVVGHRGQLTFDLTRPDGAPRKLLDSSRIAGLGWRPSIALEEGVARTYAWYRQRSAVAA
jgi:nucleoside-diphosphate-sugar epimerase